MRLLSLLRRAWAWLLTRDPTMALLVLALFAALTGASLLLPGSAFAATPVYATLRDLPVPEDAWGAGWALDGMGLAYAATPGAAPSRTAVLLASTPLWLFFGSQVLLAGLHAGLFSVGGSFILAGGLYCILAPFQWQAREAARWTA